jgi:hypothetical protein
MAVLTIKWGSADRVSPYSAAVTPRDSEEGAADAAAPPAPPAGDRPIWVYVASGASTEGFDKVESVVLTDDKIAVGSNAFRCVKMTPEQAASDPLLAGTGSAVPRFVFVSHDYQTVEVLHGRTISVSGTYGAMKKVAKKSYETNFDKNVRALVKLLNEFDKIANERGLLDAKVERDPNASPADQRKIAQERDALAAREKEANALRDELLRFQLRTAA